MIIKNKRFARFLIKFNDEGKQTFGIIKQCVTKKYQYIGVFKQKNEIYVYVQLQKQTVSECNIRTKFKKIGNIIYGPVGFKNINRLQLIAEEGSLINRGPKRSLKIININGVGEEDVSHITNERMILMIKSQINKQIENFKFESKECICYTSKCFKCNKEKCDSIDCRFSQDTNHTNRACGILTPLYMQRNQELEDFLQDIFIPHYCRCEGDKFYNEFENLLYKNKNNHNIRVYCKKGTYSFFDGFKIKNDKMNNYYRNVIKKRIELLYELTCNAFESWKSIEEKYGKINVSRIEDWFMHLLYDIDNLNEKQTPREVYASKMTTRMKTKRSHIGVINGMKSESVKLCIEKPMKTICNI